MQSTKGNILLISSEFPPGPGGIGTHAFQLTQELGRLGWKLYVVTEQNYCPENEIKLFNESVGFPVYQIKAGPSINDLWKRWKKCKAIIRDFKPDLIIATNRLPVYFSSLLSRRFSIPLVAIGHGTEFGVTLKRKRFYNRRAYRRAALIIAVSEYTKKQILSSGIKAKKITVIPNGADHNKFRKVPELLIQEFKAKKDLTDRRIILTVGSISPRKGQWVIIEALPERVKDFPDLLYDCVGLDTNNSVLQNRVKELGIEKNVLFAGRCPSDEVLLWYNACDIFAMTSTRTGDGDFEGFGIAVIEAALCGKPAIVSDNSGLTEAVENNVTGIITKEKDPSSVAQALELLLINNDLRTALGEAAYQKALDACTWEKVIKNYDRELKIIANSR
jgi:phosphatidyl-myo-inositol dimannoside synthase